MAPKRSEGMIFISYRRDEHTASKARNIYLGLKRGDGSGSFIPIRDVDDIPRGVPWKDWIDGALEGCDTFIAVIGREWRRPAALGKKDYFYDEVKRAYEKPNQTILVVFLENVSTEVATNDPEHIVNLLGVQGFKFMSDETFKGDMRDLMEHIRDVRARREAKEARDATDARKLIRTNRVRRAAIALAAVVAVSALAGAVRVGLRYRGSRSLALSQPIDDGGAAGSRTGSTVPDARVAVARSKLASPPSSSVPSENDTLDLRRKDEQVLLMATVFDSASANEELRALGHSPQAKACVTRGLAPPRTCLKLVGGTSYAVLVGGSYQGWSLKDAQQMRACLSRGRKPEDRPIVREGRLYLGRCLMPSRSIAQASIGARASVKVPVGDEIFQPPP